MWLSDVIKKLRPEEKLSILLTIVAAVILILLKPDGSYTVGSLLATLINYFSFGNHVFAAFFMVIWVLVVWQIYIMLYNAAVTIFVKKTPWRHLPWKSLLSTSLAPLRLLWPLALYFLPLFALLSVMGQHLQFNTKDLWLNHIDNLMFGFSPFLHFPTTFQNPDFENLVSLAYLCLQFVIAGLLTLFLGLGQITLLRKFIFCFLMTLCLSFPFFAIVPCQDPNNYFIKNIRHHELPASIETELSTYAPSALTTSTMARIADAETDVAHNDNVPVSCFPSSHAMWSMMVVYFFAALEPWTLIIMLPWIFCLLSGGIYYGQHYFVDYIMALIVTIVCIVITNRVIKAEQHE